MPKERFHEKLMEVLKTHPDFLDDEKGELLRAAVIDRAWQLDHSLIRLLLKDDALKEKFFDIIKGNNLLALHTLKQQFRGQIKLIYINPPYNTVRR